LNRGVASAGLNAPLRLALFADSFREANGVATLSRELASFAERQQLPFCCVHAGPERRACRRGSVTTLELNRSRASFPLDRGLYCDPLLSRHKNWAVDRLRDFRPDLVHITGPGDFGILGFWVSHTLGIPLVASWHTNLHKYASKRLQGVLPFVPRLLSESLGRAAESLSLDAAMRFYRLAHFVLAPNQEMVDQLRIRTHRPAFLMAHGVDHAQFSPVRRRRTSGPVSIGYVGRLTPEKNVRWFSELEGRLLEAGERNFRLVLVGDGSECEWLKKNLRFGELPGVLRGDSLAAAFADMDIFVFPSLTDTFGLVILEAMASGVPVVVSPETGARVQVRNGVTGFLAEDFTESVLQLIRNEDLRQSVGAAAREFACSKSWSTVFEGFYETCNTALKAPEVRSRIRTRTSL
jgi:phosphatidylinositol alpha 1,6-mannosyltransferase